MTVLPSSPDAAAFSRRTAIKHAGLAAAALAGLGGCTSYGAGGGTSSSAPATSAAATVRTADIPVGGGTILADLQAVVTQPTAGEFNAFSAICTHQACPVTEVTDSINCNCHGSRFSIIDGSVVNPPATRPLPAKQVSVAGDTLTIT